MPSPRCSSGAGFEPAALIATHGDFDHLLGRAAYPQLSLGVPESTMLRFRAEPGAAQRELRDFDSRHYVERPGPLALGQVQSLPVPGKLELGAEEVELHPAEGHTADGMALFAPWCGLLACGDYVSAVEIPWISPGGSLAEYQATLARLAGLAERAEAIVPGHGPVHTRDEALRLIDQDLGYLDALSSDGEGARLPEGRTTAFQRWIHRQNAQNMGDLQGR